MTASRDERRRDWIVLLASGALLVAASAITPHGSGPLTIGPWALPSTCTMQRWFGLPCALCGMTHAFAHAARLDLALAWHSNPAGLALFALVAAQLPLRVQRLRRRRPATAGETGVQTERRCSYAAWLLLAWAFFCAAVWMARLVSALGA